LRLSAEKDVQGGRVFWWFERAGQFLRYEASVAATGGFELRIVEPDGTERVERFDDSSALARRQADFEHQISAEGWTGPHGWNV
jgi:hypothetical protein